MLSEIATILNATCMMTKAAGHSAQLGQNCDHYVKAPSLTFRCSSGLADFLDLCSPVLPGQFIVRSVAFFIGLPVSILSEQL